jgi:mono/diheme cytochrome c family protein
MRTSARVFIGMTGFAILSVALGCGKGSNGSSTPTGTNPPLASGGSGAQVFAAQNCGKCHATEAGKRGEGPNLAGIAKKPDRTADWIVAHVKNPTTHKETSSMPAFEGKVTDSDLKALAEYLLTLN